MAFGCATPPVVQWFAYVEASHVWPQGTGIWKSGRGPAAQAPFEAHRKAIAAATSAKPARHSLCVFEVESVMSFPLRSCGASASAADTTGEGRVPYGRGARRKEAAPSGLGSAQATTERSAAMLARFTTKLAAATIAAVALATVATGLALALDIAPNPPTCEGKPVTILGTPGADFLVGTPGPDVILGGDGNDVIRGLGGNDVICGGQDDDDIYGEAGNDIAYGGPGNDRLSGMNGFDWVNGQDGNDHLRGGAFSDTLLGEAGQDLLDAVVNDDGSVDHVEGGADRDRVLTQDGIAGDFGSAGPDVDSCSLDAGDAVASC